LFSSTSYAVRGPVLDLAMKMEGKLKAGEKLPFHEMIYCNIGRMPPNYYFYYYYYYYYYYDCYYYYYYYYWWCCCCPNDDDLQL